MSKAIDREKLLEHLLQDLDMSIDLKDHAIKMKNYHSAGNWEAIGGYMKELYHKINEGNFDLESEAQS